MHGANRPRTFHRDDVNKVRMLHRILHNKYRENARKTGRAMAARGWSRRWVGRASWGASVEIGFFAVFLSSGAAGALFPFFGADPLCRALGGGREKRECLVEMRGGFEAGEMDRDHGVIGDWAKSNEGTLGLGRGLDHAREGEAVAHGGGGCGCIGVHGYGVSSHSCSFSSVFSIVSSTVKRTL